MELLDRILNSSQNLVVFSLDEKYHYTYFNKNHAHVMSLIWGKQIELGVCMMDYISSPSDEKKAKVNFDRALGGEEFSLVEEYGDEDLTRQYYENHYYPLKDDQDAVTGITIIVKDISDRRKKEQEAMEHEQLLASISLNTQEGIFRSTEDRGLIYCNMTLARMLGYETTQELLDTKRRS